MIFCFSTQQMTVSLPLPSGRWKKILDSADQHWLGPGSLLPEEIESNGRIELPVTQKSVVVLGREDGPRDG
jgi:maltooligosyltrehalose trehalohydrolase